jgi:hypothetical protein
MEVFMILTPEQRKAVESGRPVRIEDPETHDAYVVLTEDAFHRMRALMEYDDSGELGAEEQTGLLREFGMRAGWDDPAMDVYDDES